VIFCIHGQGRSPKAAAAIIAATSHSYKDAVSYVQTARQLCQWERWQDYVSAFEFLKFAHLDLQELFAERNHGPEKLVVEQKYWLCGRELDIWFKSGSTDTVARRIYRALLRTSLVASVCSLFGILDACLSRDEFCLCVSARVRVFVCGSMCVYMRRQRLCMFADTCACEEMPASFTTCVCV
jgi:hypothetical protein